MGAIKGTLTYTTYYVMDEPGPGFRERFITAVQKHSFRDIDVDSGKEDSMGWVNLDEPFGTELTWGKVFRDPYVCLSLRRDTIKIPKTAFEAHYGAREKAFLKEQSRDVMKKSERAALKEDVMITLRRRALADIKLFDVVWNTVDGSIRLWTHSKKIKEEFEGIVSETWGIRIVPSSPYTRTLARFTEPEAGGKLLDIEPSDLAGMEA